MFPQKGLAPTQHNAIDTAPGEVVEQAKGLVVAHRREGVVRDAEGAAGVATGVEEEDGYAFCVG